MKEDFITLDDSYSFDLSKYDDHLYFKESTELQCNMFFGLNESFFESNVTHQQEHQELFEKSSINITQTPIDKNKSIQKKKPGRKKNKKQFLISDKYHQRKITKIRQEHTCLSEDNQRHKIQVCFIQEFCYMKLNKLVEIFLPYTEMRFEKVRNDIAGHITIQFVKALLSKPIIQFFCTKSSKNNQKLIKYIKKIGETNLLVRSVFSITYEDFYTHLFIRHNNIFSFKVQEFFSVDEPSFDSYFTINGDPGEELLKKLRVFAERDYINFYKMKKGRKNNRKLGKKDFYSEHFIDLVTI